MEYENQETNETEYGHLNRYHDTFRENFVTARYGYYMSCRPHWGMWPRPPKAIDRVLRSDESINDS